MSSTSFRRSLATTLATTALVAATVLPVATTATAATEPLGDAAARHGRTIGFALDPGRLSESSYQAVADREFSLVVAENAMKWDATEPSRGSFSWGAADQVASYAAAQGADLYGHTLVWHQQLPGWVQGLTGADLRTAMTDHVRAVAGHFAGDVEAWDVVNEAFEDDGSRRQSVFQQRLGDGYIEDAFRAARAADPDADLCLNDYSTDGINAKSTAIYDLVADFTSRGVPIDCVGFQAHLIVGQVPSTLTQNLQRFADLGVDVRITELDIRMNTPADASRLAQQASDYAKVFQACLDVDRCTGVTLWGITDRYSWIPGVFPGQGAALVWDDAYAPKPAYAAIAEVLGAQDDGPGGDDQAPSAPTGLRVSGTTTSSISLGWNASSDDVGVAGYRVYRDGTQVAEVSGTSFTDTGLAAGASHVYAVRAVDAAGNASATSGTVTGETAEVGGGPTGACTVAYAASSWNTGFTGSLRITNDSAVALHGWTLTFAFPDGQTVTQGWSAQYAQQGSSVTVTPAPWNTTLGAGASVDVGFNGSHSGINTEPSSFTLDGAACDVV
ncbi:endo-1,4-beta-xylanase [Cellulosimicrobium cellulans]|uniref:endo-1,4-beta-xylanase n=1 Tax=Cellulosimicrobium cellulans TaxID=1710 RepID=UPI001EF934D7|nr:endo-1,4-beta-xylanase [Cellulosimicrobium cellulans]MBM7819423.1 endo-1,4-beta-xylanase [Cellulosimicrobium cellulans]